MTCSIVIPVRSSSEGKSRLAAALAPQDRANLVERMLCHVLEVAVATVGRANVHVVSRDTLLLARASARGCATIRETGIGLNPALEQAAKLVPADRPLLALSADLPLLSHDDLGAMLAQGQNVDVVAATDRGRIGTNALLQKNPRLIRYAFGQDSLALHRKAAGAARASFAVLEYPGLSCDLDEPGDLAFLNSTATNAA